MPMSYGILYKRRSVVELNNYLIDTVEPVMVRSETADGYHSQVKMKTYRVAAADAPSALQRFTEEQAGEVMYEGEPANFIIIGIDKE